MLLRSSPAGDKGACLSLAHRFQIIAASASETKQMIEGRRTQEEHTHIWQSLGDCISEKLDHAIGISLCCRSLGLVAEENHRQSNQMLNSEVKANLTFVANHQA